VPLSPSSPIRRLAALAASIAAPLLVLAFFLFGLPAPAQASNVVVNNCTQNGLRAAIIAAGNSGLVTFNCTIGGPTIVLTQTQPISRDVTIDGGGVITISGGDAHRMFSVPAPQKATLMNITLADGRSSQGGALIVFGLAVISNVTFIHNHATRYGGAIDVSGPGTAEVSNSRFYSNTATNFASQGGAIHSAGGLGVDQSYFFGNTAHNGSGGAIGQASGAAVVVASTFISNGAEFGGAIRAQGGLTLVGDQFDRNATPDSFPSIGHPGGGALHLGPSSHVLIRQSRFVSNTAEVAGFGVGGAIVSEGTLGVLNTLFSQNSALSDGGALFNDSDNLAITLSTFSRNSALGEGGAISNTGQALLTTSTFVSNTAGASGGAIANARSVFVQYSLLFNNSAPTGGAVRNHPGFLSAITASTLYSNTATAGAGGAVLNNGAIFAFNSTFVANDAFASGGAIFNIGGGGPPPGIALENSTVVSNTAAGAGAALGTITGTVYLVNSIVAFNTPLNCKGVITAAGNNLQYNGMSCGPGILKADPLLGPLQDNGGPRIGVLGIGLPTLLPLPGSPAINGGEVDLCQPTDERGFPRTISCDLGALQRELGLFLPLVEK
jgi:predicted outer membrane repeat protein